MTPAHSASTMEFGTAWRIVLAATVALLLLVLLTPVVGAHTRAVMMAAFSGVCHQLPERTLHVAGVPLAVCSRCLGIYGGMVAGVVAFPRLGRWDTFVRTNAGYVLLVAVAVPGLDWLAGILGFWDSSHVPRLLTGAVFGCVAGYFLARAAVLIRMPPAARENRGSQTSSIARS